MFKKLFQIAYAGVNLFFILAFGFAVANAQQSQSVSIHSVFIPAVFNSEGHSITGKIVNPQNIPMTGVTIRTDKGQSAVTDQNGEYVLKGLAAGSYTLTPSHDNIVFSPATSTVVVPPDATLLNFTAQVQCAEAIVNGSFEGNNGWEIPSTAYPAAYSTTQAYTGSRSMRTGIINQTENISSYSSAREKVTIPAGSTSASLTFWSKTYSGETTAVSLPAQPEAGITSDSLQMSGDVQYVLVLDSNYNILDTLLWQLSDSQKWNQFRFNLAKYAGKTIWVQFGTYNDGAGGVSSMFVDDVSLDICPGSVPPTPGTCTNLMKNPGFEAGSDWQIPLTDYPAGYSTAQAHSGSRSMRSGILKLADNTHSYSDFRQEVHVPSGTTAAVRFWLYTLSTESTSTSQIEAISPTGMPFEQTTLSGDLQYVLILDQNQNWIDTLVWQHTDDGYWHNYEFDLHDHAGETIYLQFGTYNDGINGITSMFVDDVAVDDCPVTPTPSPCQELIVNNKFELNTGWVILDTGYHAGYSNIHYYSPTRSMRTGIVNAADNMMSYSDFRQVVSIPSTAHHVTLSTWMYFTSSETTSQAQIEQIAPTGQLFSETTLSGDLQYLLILDHDQKWIGTLVWQRSNSQAWTNMQFDLSAYAGQTIMLQWGTYNNGTGGVTSMWVDDVSLQACP